MSLLKRRYFLQLLTLLVLLLPTLGEATSSLKCAGIHSPDASTSFETKVQQSLAAFLRQYDVDPDWRANRSYEDNKRIGHSHFDEIRRIDKWNQPEIFYRHGGDSEKTQYVLNRNKIKENSSTIDLPAIESGFPYPEFLGETWFWKDGDQPEQRYRFANVGFRQMKRDWPSIESAVQTGLENNESNLVMTLNPQMVLGRSILETWRKWNSQKVTDVYKKRKNYLALDDLYHLRETDKAQAQTDEYLVLMKDQGLLPIEMTSQQYEENLMAVVRLVRMEQNDPYFPSSVFGSWKGGLRLPVTERNEISNVGKMLDDALNGLVLAGKRVAEISRYVRFHDFPEPIRDAFLKNLFELSVRPQDPIDILIISVDAKTRNLFGPRYRFKDLIPLNDGDRSKAEYVMYLDTNSEEFNETLSELRDRSKLVMRNQEVSRPPQSRWAPLWGEAPGARVGSGYEKYLEGQRQAKLWRSKMKHLNSSHVSWNIANLSEHRPADKNRVEEIVNWVVSGQFMPLLLRQRIETLTAQDHENLYRNVSLFSSNFAHTVGIASDSFPINGKFLIFQKGPENFVEMISSEYNGRDVHQGDPDNESSAQHGTYDGMMIIGIYENLKSDSERLALLQKAAAHLRSGGQLTIFGPFKFGPDAQSGWGEIDPKSETNITGKSLYKALLKYAKDIFESGAPMSERELALELGLRRQFYEFRLNTNLGAVAISNLARTVGFTQSHSSQDTFGIFGYRVITLWKQ
jgi:hypothetical protein